MTVGSMVGGSEVEALTVGSMVDESEVETLTVGSMVGGSEVETLHKQYKSKFINSKKRSLDHTTSVIEHGMEKRGKKGWQAS